MVISIKHALNAAQTALIRAKQQRNAAEFRPFRKLFRSQWLIFRSRTATMYINATKLCAQEQFFLFLTNRFLRGVADDGKQKQPEIQIAGNPLFNVGSSFVS